MERLSRHLWLVCGIGGGLLAFSCSSSKPGSNPHFDIGQQDVPGEDGNADRGGQDEQFGDGTPLPYDIGEAAALCMQEPFGFGCPCGTNAQCAGGFCMQSEFGFICTQECVEECPDPTYECKGISGFGPDVVFLCVPKVQPMCLECEQDYQCGEGVCAKIGDGKHCTVSCGPDKPCPLGYVCPEGTVEPTCMPVSGDCACIPKTAGDLRTCDVVNEDGVCEGVEVCDAELGWSGCTAGVPAAEVCDGVDNDCNGKVDDALGAPPACSQEIPDVGSCPGVSICLGAEGWKCDAPTPSPETCDFQDNDCDGEVDEDFKADGKYAALNHCGTCNHDCTGTLPHATASCDGSKSIPVCVVESCDEGYFPINEFQCLPLGQVLCKPCAADIECQGGSCLEVFGASFCSKSCEADPCPETFECKAVDGAVGQWCLPVTDTCDCFSELAGTERPCLATGDEGSCPGMQTCDPLVGWSACSAQPPSAEVCDGLDNDCDGVPDDGLGNAEACTKSTPGIGTCDGVKYCAGAPGWVCDAPQPALETCDYLDNDCDGEVDEGFVIDGKYTTAQHCGACNKSCDGALPHATAYCDTFAPVPSCRVLECDPGYYKLNDLQCILPQDTACSQCLGDDECFFAKCVPLADGSFCLNPCDEGACAEGFQCEVIEGIGEACVPDSGSCLCTEASKGTQKGCSLGNEHGVCFGYETCDPPLGWTGCTAAVPAAEECDGVDSDCDGLVDEGLPVSQPCDNSNEFGSCAGEAVCFGQQGWQCLAAVPVAELCNYKDDDCDGLVDEDFRDDGKYTKLEHCGVCNNDCTGSIPNATAKCDTTYLQPKCVVDLCDAGYVAAGPFQCLKPLDTTCQACKSNADCLGGECVTIDGALRCAAACADDSGCGGENACLPYPGLGKLCQPMSGSCECNSASAGGKQWCSSSNEFGTCVGFRTCDPAKGWSDCNAALAKPEECNGLDDNCNSLVDDGLPESKDCEKGNQWGSCKGMAVCLGNLGWVCQALEAQPEICDFKDNDCDTLVDEDFKDAMGKYSTFEHCGSCNVSCKFGFPNATAVCDAKLDAPECVVESCNPGYYKINAYQCVANTSKLCDSCVIDDNCGGDGALCIQLPEGKYCGKTCKGNADCPAGYGCKPFAGSLQCVPLTNSCECDGSNTQLSKKCSATWPPEPAEGESFVVCYGTQACTAQGWTECQLPDDVCDALDNDCNGAIDDGFLVDGKYVDDTNCGQCGNNCTFLQFPNAIGVCDAQKAVPDCVMDCQPGWQDVNDNPADGCECFPLPGPDVPDGIDQNCDGVDGQIDAAIFVAKNGSDLSPGTIDAPMLTLTAAIARSLQTGKSDVYVATGVYSGSIQLKPGVRLYGGYTSDFKKHDSILAETVIMGGAYSAESPGAVNAIGISGGPGTTVLAGFTVFGKNNNTPGGSSYALYVRNCTNALVVSDNRVVSGAGGNGSGGLSGANGVSGQAGSNGGNAYGVNTGNCGSVQPPFPRPGGGGGAGTCNAGSATAGGQGGGNTCPSTYNAAPVAYENGSAGSGTAPGGGGAGGYDREVWYCSSFPGGECHQATGGNEVGNAGAMGGIGSNGNTASGNGCSAAAAQGQLVGGLWGGGGGLAGGNGANGSGGGGGGAGGGAQDGSGCSGRTQVGGTGGGGGSGGCGGTGGAGGAPGGGSFGLFIVWDAPPATIPQVMYNGFDGSVGGAGGSGGNGGSGGPGGAGGSGGAEDYANAKCAAPGGNGGNGGNGGHGEGGGGGCGGASYCIFASGQGGASLAAYKDSNSFVVGAGGPGGAGGASIGNPGDPGQAGAAANANY